MKFMEKNDAYQHMECSNIVRGHHNEFLFLCFFRIAVSILAQLYPMKPDETYGDSRQLSFQYTLLASLSYSYRVIISQAQNETWTWIFLPLSSASQQDPSVSENPLGTSQNHCLALTTAVGCMHVSTRNMVEMLPHYALS